MTEDKEFEALEQRLNVKPAQERVSLEQAARMALEGLEKWGWGKDPRGADEYITALRQALERPEPIRRKGAHWTEDYPDSPVLDDFPVTPQERKPSYEELERIADELQDLCDKQALHLGALEQPAQQLSDPCRCGKQTIAWCMANTCSKAEQPARNWVGLTDEQRDEINNEYQGVAALLMCEAKLREKNA